MSYFSSKVEELEFQQKLEREYVLGVWKNAREASLRHGVPYAVVGKLVRRIRASQEEDLREQEEAEVTRTLLQIESVIARAFEAFEISRMTKRRCRICKGGGEDEDGDTCEMCNGFGYIEETRAGDSKHLKVVLEGIDRKAKIRKMYGEKTTVQQLFNFPEQRTTFMSNASTEQLIEMKRLMLEIKGVKPSGVVDVEFEAKESPGGSEVDGA